MNKIEVWLLRRRTRKTKKMKLGKGKSQLVPVFSYAVQWKDPRSGKTKTETIGGDEVLAQIKVRERRQELEQDTYKGTTTITWDRFVDEHLKVVKATKSPKHHEGVKTTLRFFTEICKPTKPSAVDYQMLEKYVTTRLNQGIANTTVNGDLAELQGVFTAAVDRGYLQKNPVQQHRKKLRQTEPESKPVIIEPDEFGALLQECHNDVWRGMVTMGYFAGLRKSEMTNLKWDDVDFGKTMLHVVNQEDHQTKSRKIRQIPMCPELINALVKLHPQRFRCDYVFTTTQGGRLKYNVSNQFTRIVVRAGFTTPALENDSTPILDKQGNPRLKNRITLHNLRDTFITNLLESGMDPRSVMELAGHS